MEDCYSINTQVDYGVKLSKNDEINAIDATLYKCLDRSLRHLICIRSYILYDIRLVS